MRNKKQISSKWRKDGDKKSAENCLDKNKEIFLKIAKKE